MSEFVPTFDASDPRVTKGWFSRRNATSEKYLDSREAQEDRVQDWLECMAENAKARAKRSPKQQLALLDKRLGKGKGAVKERKRLNSQLEGKKSKKKN